MCGWRTTECLSGGRRRYCCLLRGARAGRLRGGEGGRGRERDGRTRGGGASLDGGGTRAEATADQLLWRRRRQRLLLRLDDGHLEVLAESLWPSHADCSVRRRRSQLGCGAEALLLLLLLLLLRERLRKLRFDLHLWLLRLTRVLELLVVGGRRSRECLLLEELVERREAVGAVVDASRVARHRAGA